MASERKYTKEDFYREQSNFQTRGRYDNPYAVKDYIASIERDEPTRAVRLYEQVANDNLTSRNPDYEIVDNSISRLKKMGEKEKAEGLERMRTSKLEAVNEAAMMKFGWNTMVRRRVKAGIKEGAANAVLITALLGVIAISTKSITGNVIGAARNSAAWSVVLGLIALLSGLFLILNERQKES